MFALQGGLVRQRGPVKDLPYTRRNPNWKGGGVPRGGTEHAGNAYWFSSMNPDGVPQKMPKVGETWAKTSRHIVSTHDLFKPSRKRAPPGVYSASPNVSAMGIVPPANASVGAGPSQAATLGSSDGRPDIGGGIKKEPKEDPDAEEEDFFDAVPPPQSQSPFFSSDNPFQSGPLEGSPLEFETQTPSTSSSTSPAESTSSIFPGHFPSSTTGVNGGPEMSMIPNAPSLGMTF